MLVAFSPAAPESETILPPLSPLNAGSSRRYGQA